MAESKERGILVPYLEAWRRERALTQRELADTADVGRSAIIRGESGETISLRNVRKLADALGISVSRLLHEAPPDADDATKIMGAA